MSAVVLYESLIARGVRFLLRGASLRIEAPEGVLTPELRGSLRDQKAALQAMLRERVVVIDFETRSLAKLKEVGGRAYVAHPSTEVLCCVAEFWNGDGVEWHPGEPPPNELFRQVAAGVPLVAHNGDKFDRFVWAHLGWPCAVWIDTLPLARLLGLPGKLDDLAAKLIGTRKDVAGRKLTLSLSRPDRTGALRPVTQAELDRVTMYCQTDVHLLANAWRMRIADHRDAEADLRELDRKINDRGFAFDVELARAVVALESAVATELKRATCEPDQLVSSPARLKAFLAVAGIEVANVQRATIATLFDDPHLPDNVARVLKARIASTGVAAGKLRAALRRVNPDGRLHDTLVYYAAHTGRWSGQGFQPQNLPRIGSIDVDAAVAAALAADKDALERLALAAGMTFADALGALVRPCIVAPTGRLLSVMDFSAIEARVLLWLAGDEAGLDVFREGRCPYKEMASRLFHVPVADVDDDMRQLGKCAVLGCGFGMKDKFRIHAEKSGVDWSGLSFTPEDAVEAWRDAHALIAGERDGVTQEGGVRRVGGLWRQYEVAAMAAVRSRDVVVGPVVWRRAGHDVVCVLPSGRLLVYPQGRIELRPSPWGLRPTFVFDHRGRPEPLSYGARLVENVTQGVARDVLADALVRLDAAAMDIVLHVHDEVVCEIDGEPEHDGMRAIMEMPPVWASGLPLKAKGYVARRYRK